jgi:hypothetical protein
MLETAICRLRMPDASEPSGHKASTGCSRKVAARTYGIGSLLLGIRFALAYGSCAAQQSRPRLQHWRSEFGGDILSSFQVRVASADSPIQVHAAPMTRDDAHRPVIISTFEII